MSSRELKRRQICRMVMVTAWRTFKRSMWGFSTCLRMAWGTVRCRLQIHYSKVRGTSYGNRQEVLRRLSLYRASDIRLSFLREPDNEADPNAILVIATVRHRGSSVLGFVSKDLAASLASLMDTGREVVVMLEGVTGIGRKEGHLGLNFAYVVM